MIYLKTIYEKIEELINTIPEIKPNKFKDSCIICHGTGRVKRTEEELVRDNFYQKIKSLNRKYKEFIKALKTKKCTCINPDYIEYIDSSIELNTLINLEKEMNIPKEYKKFSLYTFQQNISDRIYEFINNGNFEYENKKYFGFYFSGTSGTGKSHLAIAIQNAIVTNRKTLCRYENVPKLFFKIKKGFEGDRKEEYFKNEIKIIEALIDCPYLILDDIGVEKPTDFVKEKIYLIIDERFVRNKPTIYTSNCPAEELEIRLGQRIISRIMGMAIQIDISGKDWR